MSATSGCNSTASTLSVGSCAAISVATAPVPQPRSTARVRGLGAAKSASSTESVPKRKASGRWMRR